MLGDFPIVVLTGPRQVGKSTLLQQEFPDFSYLTLDDFDLREKARTDPHVLWLSSERVVLDEVQKAPALMDAVKLAVDRAAAARTETGSSLLRSSFLLSGSANLLLMKGVTESLAGRAGYVELLPLTYGETLGVKEPANFDLLWKDEAEIPEQRLDVVDPIPHLMRGSMPPLLHRPLRDQVLSWFEGYVKTYLERDLRDLSQVDSLIDFRRLMQALALRTGSILNQASVAKDCGLSSATTSRYIRLLEVSHLLVRVGAFSVNRTKRLVKSPKIFWTDPGLSCFLAGYFDRESLEKSREIGGFFESLVCLHLRGLCASMTPQGGLFYWRTVSGAEVDFVVEHGRKLLAFEVKLTPRPAVQDARNLLLFLEEYPETVRGVLVHAGNEVRWLHSRVLAVPWWWLDL